jgi:hypothetical protein
MGGMVTRRWRSVFRQVRAAMWRSTKIRKVPLAPQSARPCWWTDMGVIKAHGPNSTLATWATRGGQAGTCSPCKHNLRAKRSKGCKCAIAPAMRVHPSRNSLRR